MISTSASTPQPCRRADGASSAAAPGHCLPVASAVPWPGGPLRRAMQAMLPQPPMRLGRFCVSGRSDDARGAQCRSCRPDDPSRRLPPGVRDGSGGARGRARRAALRRPGRRARGALGAGAARAALRGSLRQRLQALRASAGVAVIRLRRDRPRLRAAGGDARCPGRRSTASRICPPGLLHWLLPSRLCASDMLGDRAWELFGETPRGAERVQAVCDWIHDNVEYGVPERADDDGRRGPGAHGRGLPRLRAPRRDVLPRAGHPRSLRLGLPARHRHPRAVSDDGLPRLVRGLAGRRTGGRTTLASTSPASGACRSVAAATRSTSRW